MTAGLSGATALPFFCGFFGVQDWVKRSSSPAPLNLPVSCRMSELMSAFMSGEEPFLLFLGMFRGMSREGRELAQQLFLFCRQVLGCFDQEPHDEIPTPR